MSTLPPLAQVSLAQVSISHSKTTDGNFHIYLVTPTVPDPHIDFVIYENAFNKAIQPSKASGPDNIEPDHIKAIRPHTSGLYNVIKSSINQCKFPIEWKNGKVVCLHKKRLQIRLQQLQTNHST